MKSLFKLLMATLLLGAFAVSTASADADKGQRYYLKIFKPQTGFNGTKFAAMHSQAEWEEQFANGGEIFIEEWSEEYPKLAPMLQGDKFKEGIMPHIKDFAIKYANDSGNVPSC